MKDYEQLTQKTNEFLQDLEAQGFISPCEAVAEDEYGGILIRRKDAYTKGLTDAIGCVADIIDFARENGMTAIVSSMPRKGTLLIEDHCYPCILLG